jgi:hypothetical protein
VSYGDDGMATIDFTGRGVPSIPAFSTAPVSVSRAIAPVASHTPAVSSAAHSSAAPTAHEPIADHPAASDPKAQEAAADEMYEHIVQRLRRDLIAELELGGHLLRDDYH